MTTKFNRLILAEAFDQAAAATIPVAEEMARNTIDIVVRRRGATAAIERDRNAEFTPDAIHFSFARAEQTPGVQQVVRPKMLHTQTGKAATVKAWIPGAKPAFNKYPTASARSPRPLGENSRRDRKEFALFRKSFHFALRVG